jgi:hypothetical protein
MALESILKKDAKKKKPVSAGPVAKPQSGARFNVGTAAQTRLRVPLSRMTGAVGGGGPGARVQAQSALFQGAPQTYLPMQAPDKSGFMEPALADVPPPPTNTTTAFNAPAPSSWSEPEKYGGEPVLPFEKSITKYGQDVGKAPVKASPVIKEVATKPTITSRSKVTPSTFFRTH